MKAKNILFAGLAGIVLAACTSDMALEDKATVKYNNHNLLKVEVVDGGSAVTRADYSGFPSTTFEEGDSIGLYAFDGSSYVVSNAKFVKLGDDSWESSEEVPYVEGYTYYAYFPYRSTTYMPSTSGTVDDIDTKFASFISDASNYYWKANQSTKANFTYSNLMIAKGSVTDVDSETATVKFTMEHKRGLAVFTEDASSATFSGNIPYLIGTTKQFLMKPSASTSFTDDSGTYSLAAAAGEYVSHKIVIPAIDLSMVDNDGSIHDDLSMTTANCYLVHETGKYRIPLVYGNAIMNDTVHTLAFYPGKDGSITNGIDRFVNHNGDGITGPWITKSGSGINAGMGLTAASAELLWQDANGLISSVSVDGDYLKFTVGTFTSGNAVIAVKDGSGTILWSWHIWATENDLSNTTVVSTGSHNYTVAPVNLGWVPLGGGGRKGYCPYYQWGRKDPFIPCDGTDGGNTNKTVYDISGTSVTGLTYQTSTTATIADNIKYPTYFYYNSSTRGPVTTTYYNMWDARNIATSNVFTRTKKTIYDPCPPGFCVPTNGLFYFIYTDGGNAREMNTWDSSNKGAVWNIGITGDDLWFPAVGSRTSGSGNLDWGVGSVGYFWSVTPYDASSIKNLGYRDNNNGWMNPYFIKGYALCVRPVTEE